MSEAIREQLIEAARSLPLDERKRLREWLKEHEREAAREQQKQEEFQKERDRFQKSLAWIKENRAEYIRQRVVPDGDRLISHGNDAREACDESLAVGIKSPSLKRIIEAELPFGGL